ncbi:MAG: inositol monophosphatase [Deltaproteobacteria bacterium]|nr:inositol monophosphatase [Deltaproteobacteria bacterium]
MSLTAHDLEVLATTAITAAREAGELIARSRPQTIDAKPGGHSPASQVVTEVDRNAEGIIMRLLAPTVAQFDLGVLTEEQPDDGARLHKEHSWCIDPLDGTLPFIEGRPGYSVSIGLIARDGTPRIGVVFDPVGRTLFHAVAGGGLFRDGDRWPRASRPRGDTLTLFTDRSFLDRHGRDEVLAMLEPVARDLGLSRVEIGPTGAAVMNACRVLAHPPACYFKFPKRQPGGGSLWDYAATACLFAEAGAVATDIEGRPLELNRRDSTFMNHRGISFASDPALAARISAVWAERRGESAPG